MPTAARGRYRLVKQTRLNSAGIQTPIIVLGFHRPPRITMKVAGNLRVFLHLFSKYELFQVSPSI